MADTKKYLSLAGLTRYDTKIKKYIEEQQKGGASNEKVELLEATHATKIVEGQQVMMTVAEEAAAAVAVIVGGADESFDTLKEIADWIKNPEGGEAFDAANRITLLEAKTANLVVKEGQQITVANAIAKAVSDETTRATGVESDLQDDIDSIQDEIDAFTTITNDEIDALFAKEESNS